MLDISIVIVNWNTKDYLRRCINSIYRDGTGYSLEVVVIDNASSDGSQEMIRELFPNVKLICNNDNLGFAMANNIGIKQCKGKYICLVNSDVEILANCFKKLFDYSEQNSTIGMLGPKILNPDMTLQQSIAKLPRLRFTLFRLLALDSLFPKSKFFNPRSSITREPDKIQEVEVLIGCFWFVRKTAIQKVGLLDEEFFIYSEDLDWCRRFHDAGYKIVYFPSAKSVHYMGGSSSNEPIRFKIEYYKSIFLYWKKHHNYYECTIHYILNLSHNLIRVLFGMFIILLPSDRRKKAYEKWKINIATTLWLFGLYKNHQFL